MSCGCNDIQQYGIKPINTQWIVTKGSTSTLEISFLELDETTLFDTDSWSYIASVYDKYNDSLEELEVIATAGKIVITATSDVTGNWGPITSFSTAELKFEVKAVIPQVGADDFVWIPVSGTVCLISDIISGGSL
jgi:hypothetical protein